MYVSTLSPHGDTLQYLKLNFPAGLARELNIKAGDSVFFKSVSTVQSDFYGLDRFTGTSRNVKRIVIEIPEGLAVSSSPGQ